VVAHVLRLRFDLLVGALRGDARERLRLLAGIVVLIAAVAAVAWSLLRLRDSSHDVASVVTVVGGAAVAAGFFIAPLLGGPEDPLDPRRFAVFGLPPTPLAAALVIASLASAPVLALIALASCLVVLWSAHGVAPVAGILSAVLGVATCVLLGKVAFAVSSRVLRQRRSRELTGLFLVALVVVVVPTAVFLSSLEWGGRVPSQLREVADVLAVTPIGAAWSIPWRLLQGTATWPVVVALLTVATLGALWWVLVRWLLTTTERPLSGRAQRGLGWFAVTPGTPAGAVAARSLVYWLRDPRYVVNVVVVPISAVLTMVPLVIAGVPLTVAALLPAPIIALFLGWIVHNDLAYDSTAIWMHIASAVRGASDRLGRLVPVTLIAVPLLALAVPITVWLHGRWAILPAMVGVCASLFLSGLGLSSVASVVSPYPAARPGDGPFQQPQRTGGAASQAIVLLGAVVCSAPALWWGWLTLSSDIAQAWTALWGGTAIGLTILIAGVLLGGWAFERRGDKVMEFAESA
jgi:ABC-2 type transport system permease protein